MPGKRITVRIPEELAVRFMRSIRPSERSRFLVEAVVEKLKLEAEIKSHRSLETRDDLEAK